MSLNGVLVLLSMIQLQPASWRNLKNLRLFQDLTVGQLENHYKKDISFVYFISPHIFRLINHHHYYYHYIIIILYFYIQGLPTINLFDPLLQNMYTLIKKDLNTINIPLVSSLPLFDTFVVVIRRSIFTVISFLFGIIQCDIHLFEIGVCTNVAS